MVAHVVDVVAIDGVFDVEPDFLVEKEHDNVVEERSHICRAHAVVAATSDANRLVAR